MSSKINILKKSYKNENNGKIKERILMIIYTLEGESSRTIGKRLQCDQKLVLYWKNRYEKEGLEGLKTRPKSGKPSLMTKRQKNMIKKIISKEDLKNPWITKRICELIRRKTGIEYTQRHVQRLLNKWGFNLLVPRPTFWQKASGEEIKKFWKKNPVIQEEISKS